MKPTFPLSFFLTVLLGTDSDFTTPQSILSNDQVRISCV